MITRCLSVLLLPAVLVLGLAASAQAQVDAPTPRMRPEPQNYSTYLSDTDFALFRQGLDAADDEDWELVADVRLRLSDTAARSVLLWRTVLSDPRVTFLELNLALEELDNWPRDSFIRTEAEAKITDSGLSAPFIVNWFESNPPTSGRGSIAYAEALLADGRTQEGEALMRETWRTAYLSLTAQSQTYQRHGAMLTAADHQARIDYLIWSDQTSAARRVLPLMQGTDHDLADARLRLAGRQSGVERAVERIPVSLQTDPGLTYERARWRRRSGMSDTLLPLLLQLPDAHANPNALGLMWTERKLMILTLIRDQDFVTAYQLARAHGMSSGADFADAEFMAGWLALVHLDEPATAMTHFTRLRDNVTTPVSLSRASYWMARAADASGEPELAATYYAEAGVHSTAYYGQLALAQLSESAAAFSLEAEPVPDEAARIAFEARPEIRAMRLLAEQGEEYYFRLFMYRLDDQITEPVQGVLLANLANEYLQMRQAVRAAKQARLNGIILPQSAYPTISLPVTTGMRPEDALVHSVIRQETEFAQDAVSGAGARGMMQLMPATAQATARSMGSPYRFNWLTDDRDYNLSLGMHHLEQVVDQYDGSYILALVAYNAGPHRANQWIENYGDPRDPDVDPIDWVESIPFSETRNYVQRVLENVQVYRTRLQDDAPTQLMIDQDLRRGAAASVPE